MIEAIERRTAAYFTVLRGGASAFNAKGDMGLAEFRKFVERLRLSEFYPGIQGVGFAKRVTADEIDQVTADLRKEAHPQFSVRPEGAREQYFPIVYLEPLDYRNKAAIGYDMFSEPTRHEAMSHAGDTGQITTSGKVTLVQEVDANKQAGFLAYAPVYSGGGAVPPTVEERRATLVGFVYSPFRASDMFKGIFGNEEPQLHFRVYDGDRVAPDALLHRSIREASANPAFKATTRLLVEGRPWTLVLETGPVFESHSGGSLVLWTLFTGLLISTVVTTIAYFLGLARMRAETYGRQLAVAQAKLQKHAEDLEKSVQERTSKLRETVAELEAFSYSLSHDMRAPLRSIQSFSHFVLADYGELLPEEARDYMQRVIAAARRMDRLIHDVLSYTKLSRQDIEIHPVDVAKLVEDLIQEQPELHPGGADLEIGELPPVMGNEASLTQCMSNLMSNAVKFVPPGVPPRVKVYARSAGGKVRITVEDHGIGIDPQYLDRVFALFERPHSGGRYEGTGLGLAIAKKAIERMNGSIGVESAISEGSKFWIELPAAPKDPGVQTEPNTAEQPTVRQLGDS